PPRQPAAQRNPHRLTLEIFCMLLHLIGLLDRVLNSQVTGAKPLQVQFDAYKWVAQDDPISRTCSETGFTARPY
ncbi:hypothetical protein, partial [Novosphingobium sp.]|uniref:hypothetical protein n=1 Tax=Novosphingobium sp. TaxID=1874826 RepID=UPI0025D35B29